jgi:hypothetical protein
MVVCLLYGWNQYEVGVVDTLDQQPLSYIGFMTGLFSPLSNMVVSPVIMICLFNGIGLFMLLVGFVSGLLPNSDNA